jgi:hypothetical protein
MPTAYYLSGQFVCSSLGGDSRLRGLIVVYSPYFDAGGTYSLGNADPSPKKNISNCFTITS